MSKLRPLLNPKESTMVVWTPDGKPMTVIRAKERSPEASMLPFQYKIPISKYNMLAHVAHKRTPQGQGPDQQGQGHGHAGHHGQVHLVQGHVSQRPGKHCQGPAQEFNAQGQGHSGPGQGQGQMTPPGYAQSQGRVDNVEQPLAKSIHHPHHQYYNVDHSREATEGAPPPLLKQNHQQQQQQQQQQQTNGRLEKEYNALKSKEQEEQVELRRLRTENRLLRQRIDNLEKETATLADRLIQDQVKYAQQEEEVYVLRREVSVARQQSQETKHKLEEVTTQLEEACNSTASSTSADLEDDVSKDDQIEELRRQLVDARQQMGESHSISRELRDKIRELESINRQMQKDPSSEMQHLQEELIACKLREAEANLSHKELQQKVHDLDRHWKKHIERQSSGGNGKPSKDRIHQLNDDLMAVRIREAEAVADLKEMKLKVMELETQNHICDRQIGRLTTENEKLKDQQEEGVERERGLHSNIRELDRKISDLDSKRKEDQMMAKIKDAEHAQTVAEMRQRIAELEIENQELVTAGQLLERGDRLDLEHKIADLQEEVLQHKMARRLQSLSSLALNNASVESESDYDTDDLEATLKDAQRLTLVSSLTGMDLEAALRSQQRLRLAELDSSEGENGIGDANIGDSSATNNRQKCTRKKKKASSSTSSSLKRATRADVDFDKTPTQDTFNTEMFLIENGTVNNSNGVVAGDAQPVTVDISDTSSSPDAQPDSRSTLNGSDSPSLASTASS